MTTPDEPQHDGDSSVPEFSDTCRVCATLVGWTECPTGGWWAHDVHPGDGHDAVPTGDDNGCYTLPTGECVGVCSLHGQGAPDAIA